MTEQAEGLLGHDVHLARLDPGRYAWISEGYAARGMVKEFSIE